MLIGTVALVGRPNVGKSTVFNRMVGERISIVNETPGVTRDRIYGTCNWLTRDFHVIDTGGLQIADQPFQVEIRAQVDIAIEESDVVVMITDGPQGVTDDDRFIARLLQKSGRRVILAVNKIDDISAKGAIYDFYQLGLGDPIAISGVHGIGIGDLLDEIVAAMEGCQPQESYEGMVSFAVIGRPNVGKSSLVNSLLNEQRVIVSSIEGTTRDAIDTPFERDGHRYVVIDTAGIRKRGRVYESIEKYAVLRAMKAIDRSNVVLFLLDASTGIRDQDKHVAGYAVEAGKGVIIVYNKYDLIEKDQNTMDEITRQIRSQFQYLDYAPVAFVSAKSGSRVNTLFPLIDEVYRYSQLRVATPLVTQVITEAQITTPPPARNGRRLKISFAEQVAVAPPTFVLFCNDPDLLHFSYRRYLENRLREAFGFDGNPIHIIARKK